ncbi:hypothetical protein Pmani_036155 [Petrolisthes manimaculis]|uniref:Uncharacterized protein n=1 Tax=Petrolisthes manimaculis TaxID=1843537 RepID=A0AAE1NLJ7_9EUCA|nr:hypothetical protein Pmani_036155 [Petrolisthes manimaculis]
MVYSILPCLPYPLEPPKAKARSSNQPTKQTIHKNLKRYLDLSVLQASREYCGEGSTRGTDAEDRCQQDPITFLYTLHIPPATPTH